MDYGDRAIPTIHIETETLHSSCIPRDNRDHMKGKSQQPARAGAGLDTWAAQACYYSFFLFFFFFYAFGYS